MSVYSVSLQNELVVCFSTQTACKFSKFLRRFVPGFFQGKNWNAFSILMSPRATWHSVAVKAWRASCGLGWPAGTCILIQMDLEAQERSLCVTFLIKALLYPWCVNKPHTWFSLLEQWEFHGHWPEDVFITLSSAMEIKSVIRETLDEVCMILLPFGLGTFSSRFL